MVSNFKNVVSGWAAEKKVKLRDFQMGHIRDIERELDRGTIKIDEAMRQLGNISDFPDLNREDIKDIEGDLNI